MLRRRTPLKRNTTPIRRTPVRKRRKGPPRRGPANIPADEWRNEGYKEFLRIEGRDPISGARNCEPCHGPVNGGSSKGPDAGAIPMTAEHHREQHAIGWPKFEAKYGFSRETEAAVWWTAFQVWREM